MLVSQLDTENYFVCQCEDFGGPMPHGCVAAAPPPLPWVKAWPRYDHSIEDFVMDEDHRERRTEEGFRKELVQAATDYGLPAEGDTWQSPPRKMTTRGSLPVGAVTERPEKELDVAKGEKRNEIIAAHGSVLGYLIVDTPNASSVETALAVDDMRADDPDGLDYVRGLADTRRAELLAEVQAAQSVSEVEAVAVSYPV